jgi:hypothetical protein
MKKILQLLMLCVIPFGIKAQTTLTTYYIIPPTSGCNGVWAVNAASPGWCGPGTTWIFSPIMCGQMGPTVGDTLYIQLCSIPCNVAFSDFNGPCAICGTGTTTGTNSPASNPEIITTYPNPSSTGEGWNLMLNSTGKNLQIKIYNSCGQLVMQQEEKSAPGILHIDTGTLSTGTYTVEVVVDQSSVLHEKMVLTR